jgi:hypothetical protein
MMNVTPVPQVPVMFWNWLVTVKARIQLNDAETELATPLFLGVKISPIMIQGMGPSPMEKTHDEDGEGDQREDAQVGQVVGLLQVEVDAEADQADAHDERRDEEEDLATRSVDQEGR